MPMTRVRSARLREPCVIEDRVSWGTVFNAGVDEMKQAWDLWLDDVGWLRIQQTVTDRLDPTVKKITHARVPPEMIRIIFEDPEPDPIDREAITNPDVRPGLDPNWRHPKAKR